MIWLFATLQMAAASIPCRAPHACASYVIMTRQGEPLTLERARFVGADYLIAGTAPGVASRFGHAMLRLNFCGPGPGPCRADDVYAIDIGFAAQVDLHTLSVVGGVLGRYPSRLIATPDLDLRTYYNESELRDLRAYPLRLNERAKTRLLAEVAARFWTSAEPYRFFSNNCAGGLLDLLATILPKRHPLRTVNSFLLAPRGLLTYMRAYGVAGHLGGVWRSRRPGLESRMAEMRKNGLSVPGTVEQYLAIAPTTRRVWIESARTLADVMILSRLEALALRKTHGELIEAAAAVSERTPRRCTSERSHMLRSYADIAVEHLKHTKENPAATEELVAEAEVRARMKDLDAALMTLVDCLDHHPAVRRLRAFDRLSIENLRRTRVRAASL